MHPRPIEVTILSILQMIIGVVFCILLILTAGDQGLIAKFGGSPTYFIITTFFLGFLALISGIGMWLGRPWGWWLSTLLYICGIFSSLENIISLTGVVGNFGTQSGETGGKYLLFVGIILASLALLFYFFYNYDILKYFRMRQQSRANALVRLVGVAAGAAILGYVIANLGL